MALITSMQTQDRSGPAMLIKICGLSTPQTLEAAIAAGADMVAFNFHPKSPRYVSSAHAALLAGQARGKARIVALIVDQDEAAVQALVRDVRPDMLQLHGSETPETVAATAKITGLAVMKAIGVSGSGDLVAITPYRKIADHILLDAKPPKDAAYPGGHGRPFDWNILQDLDPALPFLLSGGLTPDNVAEAITTVRGLGVNLIGVDVSSGVESAPGVKDVHKIRDFIQATRSVG
jgi:phosphoribosylanthranilate isomerase